MLKPIKIKRTIVKETVQPPKEVAKKPTGKSKLPPDTYKDEIKPLELDLAEGNKFVFSVKRAGDLGLPHVDIRLYITTDKYTGFTKKGITFPLEMLYEFKDILNEVDEECDRLGIE